MECHEAREQILDGRRERLPPIEAGELRLHLADCTGCRAHAGAEQALSAVLEARLPRHGAPLALQRRLAQQWPGIAEVRRRPAKRLRTAGLFALAATLAAVVFGSAASLVQRRAERSQLEIEVVNDHLRMLGGAPLAQVAGGLHEVKPWFGGKLDFAPAVQFAGDLEFPLQGGAVEPFLDRRAAVFVYKRRLHTASLFVLQARDLPFPAEMSAEAIRGFSVALWKAGEQGYALVSDLSLPELLELQKRIASQ